MTTNAFIGRPRKRAGGNAFSVRALHSLLQIRYVLKIKCVVLVLMAPLLRKLGTTNVIIKVLLHYVSVYTLAIRIYPMFSEDFILIYEGGSKQSGNRALAFLLGTLQAFCLHGHKVCTSMHNFY